MTNDAQILFARAAKEMVLAAEEPDPIKRSHHQEFADRYLAEALASKGGAKPSKPHLKKPRLASIAVALRQVGKSFQLRQAARP